MFRDVLDKQYVDVILSYCHYSLNDRSLTSLIPYLKENVSLINASPLSMGLLSGNKLPMWHPADKEIRDVCEKAAKFCIEHREDLAKLAVQFSVANPDIPTTLVSTANPDNIRRNVNWINEPINVGLLKEVEAILQPIWNKTWSSGNYRIEDGSDGK